MDIGRRLASWFGRPTAKTALRSCLCTEQTLMSEAFQAWAVALKEAPGNRHRKVWEWCFIVQALKERGCLEPGKTGLGFAVGQEPLSSLFATFGPKLVATDMFTGTAANGWVATGQHASGYEVLNTRGLCDADQFRRLVEFKFADMNDISRELDGRFDFVWSSCALEHLGSLEHGKRFIYNAMRCLKPGGVAVHTTEYNVSSNDRTLESGDVVLFRKKDIEEVVSTLRRDRHRIDVDFTLGSGPADQFVDVPPYSHNPHLRLQIGEWVVTSIGLIVEKQRNAK